MTVQEMIDFLETQPKESQVHTSIWTSGGEKRYRVSLPLHQPDPENICISWVDDCPAYRIK